MNLRLIKQPHLTEKTMIQREANNTVTFMVGQEANKTEIKKQVEKLFGVTVLQVRTLNQSGKFKRVGKFIGKRSDVKKAIVTLKSGDKIEYFEGA